MAEVLKVPVLLERLPDESVWTAQVPYVGNCVSEGKNPEQALANLIDAIKAVATVDPTIYDQLANPPKYLITQIEIPQRL